MCDSRALLIFSPVPVPVPVPVEYNSKCCSYSHISLFKLIHSEIKIHSYANSPIPVPGEAAADSLDLAFNEESPTLPSTCRQMLLRFIRDHYPTSRPAPGHEEPPANGERGRGRERVGRGEEEEDDEGGAEVRGVMTSVVFRQLSSFFPD